MGNDIELQFNALEKRASFTVTNLGQGIEPQRLEEVFSTFAARNVEGQVVGSGMSMALTRFILRAHLGDIGVASQLGQETSFVGWLPLYSKSRLEQSKRQPVKTT